MTPLSLEDARRVAVDFVNEYHTVRLHSGIAYVTPQARLEGRDQHILAERRRKLAAARLTRDVAHHRASTERISEYAESGQPKPAQVALAPVVA